MNSAILFFFTVGGCLSILIAGAYYYFGGGDDALQQRIVDLQEHAMGGGDVPHSKGDFWDGLLRATYGTIFGAAWFRQKEAEMVRAGIRRPGAVKMYGVFSLFLTATLLAIAYWALKDGDASTLIFGLVGALVIGYFVPEQLLVTLRKRHRMNLLAALPDTTDILSIVLGAGLSLDQAIARVSDEIRFVYPALADEFYWMTLEVQAGQERAVAFQHMAQRTGLIDIRSLAGMIVQAERFGTGLAQALRIYADSLRVKRRLDIESKINKVAVKMIFPIVLFILPALFVVIMAPGILTIMRDMQSLR